MSGGERKSAVCTGTGNFAVNRGQTRQGFGASYLRFCARMVLFYFSFLSYNVREGKPQVLRACIANEVTWKENFV